MRNLLLLNLFFTKADAFARIRKDTTCSEKVRVFYHGNDERFECFTGIYEQTTETENDKPVWRHTSGKDIVLYSAPVSNWHFNTKIEKDFAAIWGSEAECPYDCAKRWFFHDKESGKWQPIKDFWVKPYED